MEIRNQGKKEILCDGPCEWEPLDINGGTLADGTTYTFNTPSTLIDLGQGTIEHGNSESLIVTFSAPVDFKFTSAVANSNRTVWHVNGSGTIGSKATSDGLSWCYNPGSVTANITIDGNSAASVVGGPPGVNANADWGNLESYKVTEVDMFAYVFDAYNYEARPRSIKCEQPVCDVVDDLSNRLKVVECLDIPDPVDPVDPIELDVCSGIFTQTNNVSGWWGAWTPVITANQGTTTHYDWRIIGSGTVPSPDCVTDMSVVIDPGSWYTRIRRARMYSWLDIRILVNGAVVYTLTNASYHYEDGRRDTNPDVINPVPVNITNIFSTVVAERQAVPAGATVEVQGRWRYNVNAVQTSPYVRVIGGLRSRVQFTFTPRNIVVGEV